MSTAAAPRGGNSAATQVLKHKGNPIVLQLAKALRARADELLEGGAMPSVIHILRPQIRAAVDSHLERIDDDPEAARTQLRPLITRAAEAVGAPAGRLV